jgi:hypothetical protein
MDGQPLFVQKPSGAILTDGQESAYTLQCGHCGTQWVPQKGSGKVRGFCTKCNEPLCGADACMRYHVPKEALLDFLDGGGVTNVTAAQKKILDKYPDIVHYPGIIIP